MNLWDRLAIPTLQEYVLVSQKNAVVDVFRRGEDGEWINLSFYGMEALVDLFSIGLQIPMSEIYLKVEGLPES